MTNNQGVPPHALHIFHIHLCTTPHIVHQNPCDTAPPMLPDGKCATLLSDCTIFYLTTKPMCHVIQKPTMHGHPKRIQHHPTAHIFVPCIHHVKFVVALKPQIYIFHDSLLALLQIPDRPGKSSI